MANNLLLKTKWEYEMEKKIFNQIVFLLDETGSMESIKDDTIGGFNTFLEEQKNNSAKIKFTFTLFNSNKVEKRYVNEPIKNVEKLTEETYIPNYTTPLLDAIGTTIIELKKKKNILFVILTDGHENSSKEFTYEKIKKLVEEKKNKFNWKFLFLGVDINDFADVEAFGMTDHFSVNKKKVNEMYMKLNKTVKYFNKVGEIKFDNKNK